MHGNHSFSVIAEEAIDSRAEVKSFDKHSLKHVETEEKTSLPTAQGKPFVPSYFST